MNNLNLPNWSYPVFLIIAVIIAGVAEYLKLAPAGGFWYVFLFALGLLAPSPAFPQQTHITSTGATNVPTSAATINTPENIVSVSPQSGPSRPAQSADASPPQRTPSNG